VRKGMTLDPAALEEYGRLISDELWRTEDHREGVQSHVDRRKPGFVER
jgi:enoyl-CoA hydratase/carnithine racemase